MNKLKIFAYDMKRAFSEPLFWGAVIAGAVMLILPLLILLSRGTEPNAGVFAAAQSMVFPFAAPVLCALPYAGMIMTEKETKYGVLMRLKICRTGYVLPRFFTVGLTGAAVLLLPQMLLLSAVWLCKADWLDIKESCKGIALAIPFGFAYSAFAFSLTFYNQKRYIPALTPQVLYLLCVYAFPHLKLTRFYPPLGISPWIYGGASYADVLATLAVLAIFSAILACAGSLKKEAAV